MTPTLSKHYVLPPFSSTLQLSYSTATTECDFISWVNIISKSDTWMYCASFVTFLDFVLIWFAFIFPAKSIPIHCVVEQTPPCSDSNAEPQVELDTYAILPGSTLFSEIVRTALIKIGYTAAEATAAKGTRKLIKWHNFITFGDYWFCFIVYVAYLFTIPLVESRLYVFFVLCF